MSDTRPFRHARQHFGEAEDIGDLKHLGQRRTAKVAVDEQDAAVVGLAERQRDVRRRQRLAFLRHGARHHQILMPFSACA
jgi:hypothetical protein